MIDEDLVKKVRKVMSFRLEKLRTEGKSITDQEIYDIMTEGRKVSYRKYDISKVYDACHAAGIEEKPSEEVAIEVLQHCKEINNYSEYVMITTTNRILANS